MLPEILLTFLLLIISSYFVLLKILKNYVAEKKQRNITSLGIAVFISPILFIIISFIFCNAVFITNQLKIITSSVFLIFNIKISS